MFWKALNGAFGGAFFVKTVLFSFFEIKFVTELVLHV